MKKFKTTLLIIVDGWGIGDPKDPGNPITLKSAPNYFAGATMWDSSKVRKGIAKPAI